MAKFTQRPEEPSAQSRLDDDPELEATFIHLWRCGPQTVGLAVAAMLDQARVSSAALDALLAWRGITPAECAWGFGDPPATRRRPVRPVAYLRLLPTPEPEA